jgi:uncharacterized YceG family protein/putative transcription antitermination factor YqgF
MKLIGLDVGEKHIGVATADSSVKIAVPMTTLNVDGTELDQISRIMHEQGTTAIVVGLPRNSAGAETAQSATVRAFAEKLKTISAKVRFQDESLTSVMAEHNLKNRKKSYTKTDIDKEAAALILQDFLETYRPAVGSPAKKNSQAKKPMRRLFKALFFLVAACVIAAVFVVSWYNSALEPVDLDCADPCPAQQFNIETAEGADSIAARLEKADLIHSALAFKIYLYLNNLGGNLKAGSHELAPNQSAIKIAETLTASPAAATFSLTFYPGETLRAVRRHIIEAGYSDESVDAALAQTYDYPISADKPATASLEGYIWADTYEFYATATPEDIISRALSEFQMVYTSSGLESAFTSQNLTFYEALTLASIIQKEAYKPDMPQVAQVFLLRLKQDIPLGSDAVIGYAADQENPDRDKTDMSYLTSIKCPWNSRRCTGLPPTPISTPGLSALEAVANPASGTYLYFLTGDDGKMYYAYTESEHNRNISLYCKELCKIL